LEGNRKTLEGNRKTIIRKMSIGNAINKCNHNHKDKDKAEEMNVCKILKVNKGEGSNNGNGKDNNSNGNGNIDSVNNLLINKQQSIAKINNQNKNPLTFQGIQPNNTTEN